ncbi:MAG: PD40 domain-containing protein [Bacteroidetes bacterium]|nr:PD40 domain-containing protein [Bacteroidota bacterium]
MFVALNTNLQHAQFYIFFSFILLFVNLSSFAQLNGDLREEVINRSTEKEIKMLDLADKYYIDREFLLALPYYDTLLTKFPDNLYLSYLLGSCSVFDADKQKSSEKFIKKAESIKSKLFDYDYYLGKSFLVNDKYDDAINQFGMYLTNPINDDLKNEVIRQISICKNAKESNSKFALAKITNIGSPINTKGSEYCPIFPSDERFMVFTYRGEKSKGGKQSMPNKKDEKEGIYFEDVFISYKGPRGEWSEPLSIDAINTTGHDAAIYLSQDGQRLFIYRNLSSGKPEKVKGINSNAWEGSVCLSPDQKTIYFSSERPGGLGGRDIYFATLQADGSWGNVKNLGPEINTKYDEDAPFVHADGKTLFFASNGHTTIGGYDIFKSEMKSGKWQNHLMLVNP